MRFANELADSGSATAATPTHPRGPADAGDGQARQRQAQWLGDQAGTETRKCVGQPVQVADDRTEVHPGFEGNLTLEMINLGPTSIILRPAMPIAQLIVKEVKGISRLNPSQFQGQATPEGSAH
jgi:hypothetical protein